MQDILAFLQPFLSIFLYLLRVLTPALSIWIVVRCFISLRRGRRSEDPVVMLEEVSSHAKIPVLYWENSIGRSRSCDIVLPDPNVSRDHAVLMRRESGWIITDTGSKSGTYVNHRKVTEPRILKPGDVISMGATSLALKRADHAAARAKKQGIARKIPRPSLLLLLTTLVQFLLAVQGCFAGEAFSLTGLLPFGMLVILEWTAFAVSSKAFHRVSFEVETIGFLLSGIGLSLLYAVTPEDAIVQAAAMTAGVILYFVLISFMNDPDRVMKWRPFIEIGAVALFAVNLLFGVASHGAQNWISLGPITVQPSEFIKIAFIFAGASTLDKLQTKKNLTEFLIFSGICIGSLILMRDFGTACIFFVTFLIIAFMRSGSIRTIFLVCAAAVFGLIIILRFRPYIMERFSAWGHVWEYADTSGYQQTRTLTYAASGGLFGVGLGDGYLKNVFAATSDLVFGVLCEEFGLVLALLVVTAIMLLIFYARSDVTRSRSTFYSISACAAAGMLLFQTCLNIFGPTDILPLTGVTLPFISAGGSSMLAVWGLLAFLKASDERTYAVSKATPAVSRTRRAPSGR
ncbi:MAG TPA: FtsW/RodA/SpoVE family cell cycle protein [Candidatus Gallacutalibacter pullicola]|uniref:FtsW/RodA/SpoVE family cell cycle protein n=1 Tax=Candidatus Gallacutalibacter pullicola TaxID=2840830 RepID=A0A9D1DQI9_9FIRM|nr:FtsW/RodA/SpoVE family cell cycle protein [Candidatus Gallacutalibacter pullicola]